MISVNDGERQILDTVSDSFTTDCGCEEWCQGVLNNVRIVETTVTVSKGKMFCIFMRQIRGLC